MIVQEYARELAICLATGGECLRHNLECATGRRLSQLMDELVSLCAAKARYDFKTYTAFVASSMLPAVGKEQDSPDMQQHWLELGVSPKTPPSPPPLLLYHLLHGVDVGLHQQQTHNRISGCVLAAVSAYWWTQYICSVIGLILG